MAEHRRYLAPGGLVGVLLLCSSCALVFVTTKVDPSATEPCAHSLPQAALASDRHFDHVLIVVFENQTYERVRANPVFSELANRGVLFDDFHGLFHPSYSNYLAMVTGREIRTSSDHQLELDQPTIAQSLAAASPPLTWKNYAEGYPGNELLCFTSEVHNLKYTRKHVPFLSFTPIQDKWCRNIVPASQFWDDFKRRALPNYAFYSPDLDDDGHDPASSPRAGLRKASDFLKAFLRPLLADSDFMRTTLTIITFDESYTILFPDSNHIYTVFLGDMVKADHVSHKYYTHYNVLRTIENNFGLPPLHDERRACAKAIDEIWSDR